MPKKPERSCRVCGCTDARACQPFGCYWVEEDLCSACDDDGDPLEREPPPRAPAEAVMQCGAVETRVRICREGLRYAA